MGSTASPERAGLQLARSRGGRGPARVGTCDELDTEGTSSPAPHRRRARTGRCGRSPAGSGSRNAGRRAGPHSCSNPGRVATPPASRQRGCTGTGSPAPRRSSSTRQGAAPAPANAPPTPPHRAGLRAQAASPPKSEPAAAPHRCPRRVASAGFELQSGRASSRFSPCSRPVGDVPAAADISTLGPRLPLLTFPSSGAGQPPVQGAGFWLT